MEGTTTGVRAIRLVMPAKAEYIALGRLALSGLSRVRSEPLSPEVLGDLKVALTEACAASVRSAAGEAELVEIVYELHPDRVVVEVAGAVAGNGDAPLLLADITDELEVSAAAGGGSRLRFVKRFA